METEREVVNGWLRNMPTFHDPEETRAYIKMLEREAPVMMEKLKKVYGTNIEAFGKPKYELVLFYNIFQKEKPKNKGCSFRIIAGY